MKEGIEGMQHAGLKTRENSESSAEGFHIGKILKSIWNKVVKVLPPLGATGAAVSLAGCLGGDGKDMDFKSTDKSTGEKTMALTAEDLNHMRRIQKASFTERGDASPNIGTLNGKTVITFNNGFGRDNNYTNCYYVMDDNIDAALAATTEAVKKVSLPYPYDGQGCPINDGHIIFGGDGTTWTAKLTESNGALQIQNPQQLPRQRIDGGNHYYDDGEHRTIAPQNDTNSPLLLSRFTLDGLPRLMMRNLITNQFTLYYNDVSECGTPHHAAEGGEWIGGAWHSTSDSSNPVKCHIAKDQDFEISGTDRVSMPGSEMDWDGGTEGICDLGRCGIDLRNPRIFRDYVLVEGRQEKLPPVSELFRILDEPELYFSKVQPYPEDAGMSTADGGAMAADGGPSITDGGAFIADGGGSSTADGGAMAADGGGSSTADGGAMAADGGPSITDGGRPDGGTTDVNVAAGCCNVSNNKPTGLAGLALFLGTALTRLIKRKSQKSPKAKIE